MRMVDAGSKPDAAKIRNVKFYSAYRPNYGVYSQANRLSSRTPQSDCTPLLLPSGSRQTTERAGGVMQTIGLIGGMSWESTAVYYRRLNEQIRARLGGLHSADILMRSVDFDAIVSLQKLGHWDEACRILADIACALERGGAGCLLICTNTMHKLADEVQSAVSIPLLHIADVTAQAIKADGLKRPLLLATRYTMEQDFYVERLRDRFGLDPVIPHADDRTVVHDIIFDELCQGIVSDASRARYLDVIARGKAKSADSVILGCTEICLLVGPQHINLPVFDSTLLHADAAIAFSLEPAAPQARAS
jgi:aspartate racemase